MARCLAVARRAKADHVTEDKPAESPACRAGDSGGSTRRSRHFFWAVGETGSRLAYIQKSRVRLLHCLPLRHNVKVAWVTVNHLVMVRVHGPQPICARFVWKRTHETAEALRGKASKTRKEQHHDRCCPRDRLACHRRSRAHRTRRLSATPTDPLMTEK